MSIHDIIYETTREIHNVEDKLRIATIFIFCQQVGSTTFSELLYTKDHKKFIESLNIEFYEYGVDFNIRLDDRNIGNSFYKTLHKIREKFDDNGYYRALFEKDEFALVINEIINYDFTCFDINKLTKNISQQLRLNL